MSNLTESLARSRHAERYTTVRPVVPNDEAQKKQAARTRAGWLLIGLGLRLALPGSRDASRRITLIGR